VLTDITQTSKHFSIGEDTFQQTTSTQVFEVLGGVSGRAIRRGQTQEADCDAQQDLESGGPCAYKRTNARVISTNGHMCGRFM